MLSELHAPDRQGSPFQQLRYWVGAVVEADLVRGTRKMREWPENYLLMLNVIVGNYVLLDEEDMTELSAFGADLCSEAQDPETGEFDGILLFHLLEGAGMRHNGSNGSGV